MNSNSTTAHEVNQLDGVKGRKVWHNFWDKQITFENSYWARLNYVHQRGQAPTRRRCQPIPLVLRGLAGAEALRPHE